MTTQAQPEGARKSHISVLLDPILEAIDFADSPVILDGTFGAGGYSRAFLERGATVLGLDQDPNVTPFVDALKADFPKQFYFQKGQFSLLNTHAKALGFEALDAVVLDIGVSSMQLDEAARGFSFSKDGPLDMRMSKEGQSAADLVNTLSAEELADILYHYGEERQSRRIAKAIVHDRKATPFTTTKQLADLLARLLGKKRGDIHPATRTFQALRIAVNEELQELELGLKAAENILKPGGLLLVVTFHSLEDRIAKRFLKPQRAAQSRHMPVMNEPEDKFEVVTKKAILPTKEEVENNPRARSAKLRVGRKLEFSRE